LRRREPELAAAGAKLLFVGSGTPAMAKDFQATHGGPHPVFSDSGRKLFQAAGMARRLGSTLHWRLVKNAFRALRSGFRQQGVQGDPWQQGGVLVFAADGELLHQQYDKAAGDVIDLDAVLAAV
jgi:hypothetical protein